MLSATSNDLFAVVIKTMFIICMVFLQDLLCDVKNKSTVKNALKHRKAPQLNMGVNYIAKHNASIDEDSDPSHKLSTTIDFLENNVSSSSTTTAITTKSYNKPTIYNSSTLATKLTTMKKFKSTSLKTLNIRKTSHTSKKNLTVARPSHQKKNVSKHHYADIVKATTKNMNVSKNDSDASIAGKEYPFSRLYLCSFIDCKMPDSQAFCPHDCHKDINAGDVFNMNMNQTMPVTTPKRPRRRKNVTRSHDSFETSYLLIQD